MKITGKIVGWIGFLLFFAATIMAQQAIGETRIVIKNDTSEVALCKLSKMDNGVQNRGIMPLQGTYGLFDCTVILHNNLSLNQSNRLNVNLLSYFLQRYYDFNRETKLAYGLYKQVTTHPSHQEDYLKLEKLII